MNPVEIYYWLLLHYTEEFSKERISKISKLSYEATDLIFADWYKIDIEGMWHELRIAHAQWLLKNSEKTLNEVAREVGYDYRTFEAIFVSECGKTPWEFRMNGGFQESYPSDPCEDDVASWEGEPEGE